MVSPVYATGIFRTPRGDDHGDHVYDLSTWDELRPNGARRFYEGDETVDVDVEARITEAVAAEFVNAKENEGPVSRAPSSDRQKRCCRRCYLMNVTPETK